MRALLIAAALGSATASDTRDLDRALAGRHVAGKPQACLSSSRTDGPQVIDNRTWLYSDGGRIWRNDLPDACPGLDDDAIVVSEVHGGGLCRNDTVYTIQRGGGIPGPRCRLGDFTPWDKAKR